jgi:hypothetical protein
VTTLRQLPNFSARLTRSVRRASGLVLVGNPEVIRAPLGGGHLDV